MDGRISVGVGVSATGCILHSFYFLQLKKILVCVNTGEIIGVWREKEKITRIFSGFFNTLRTGDANLRF